VDLIGEGTVIASKVLQSMGVNRKNGGFVVVEIMLLPVQSVCWNFHLRNLVLFSFYAILSFKLTQLVETLFSNPTYTCFLGHNWYQNTIQGKYFFTPSLIERIFPTKVIKHAAL
jgi:hypothetical protein